MEKTVYLHIGLPKTATSLIQTAYYNSPDVLHQLGIRYLQAGTEYFDDYGHHIFVMAALREAGRRIDPGKSPESIQLAWDAAMAEIATSPEDKIMISSELFALDMTTPDALHYLRDSLSGYQVKIVLVLRDVVNFVNSVYSQRVRDGYAGEIGEYVTHIWDSLNWTALVQRWAQVFGQENMVLLRFENLDRASLVDDFTRQVFGQSSDTPLFPVSQVNMSLPHNMIVFLRELNATDIPEEDKIRFRHQIHHFLGSHQAELKRADFLSEDAKTMLQRHCVWPQTK